MIQAIETIYKGYRFRSRLEARWAVFFDAMDTRWEYESEGYKFSDGTMYLPDFWLPQAKVFGEVKPELAPVEGLLFGIPRTDLDKMSQLALESGYPVLLLIGTPANKAYRGIRRVVFDSGTAGTVWDSVLLGNESKREWAANAARQARFEHGETPHI